MYFLGGFRTVIRYFFPVVVVDLPVLLQVVMLLFLVVKAPVLCILMEVMVVRFKFLAVLPRELLNTIMEVTSSRLVDIPQRALVAPLSYAQVLVLLLRLV